MYFSLLKCKCSNGPGSGAGSRTACGGWHLDRGRGAQGKAGARWHFLQLFTHALALTSTARWQIHEASHSSLHASVQEGPYTRDRGRRKEGKLQVTGRSIRSEEHFISEDFKRYLEARITLKKNVKKMTLHITKMSQKWWKWTLKMAPNIHWK